MKRTLAACFLVLGLVSFASAQDEKVTIGVSIPGADHGWTAGINYWAEQAKAKLEAAYPNLQFVIATASSDSEQASDLQDLVTVNKIDALVILPNTSDPLTRPVAQVKQGGVFVTVVDRGLSDPSIQDLYVAGDNVAFGRVAGNYFKEKLPNGGKIGILRGLPTVIDNQRFDAFNAAIKGSGITVADSQYGNWNRDDAFQVAQDMLTKNPDLDAIWASDDDMAEGVVQAVRQAGRENDLFIVGGAGKKEIIKRVMDGDKQIPVDVTYPPSMIATAMEVTAMQYTTGVAVVGEYLLKSQLVTPENAQQFYYPDSPF